MSLHERDNSYTSLAVPIHNHGTGHDGLSDQSSNSSVSLHDVEQPTNNLVRCWNLTTIFDRISKQDIFQSAILC